MQSKSTSKSRKEALDKVAKQARFSFFLKQETGGGAFATELELYDIADNAEMDLMEFQNDKNEFSITFSDENESGEIMLNVDATAAYAMADFFSDLASELEE